MSHAREARRTQRSSEENSLLRMFVSSGIVERLLPLLRTPDADPLSRAPSLPRAPADLANETIEATVAFIDICGFTPLTASEPPDQALRTLNANFEIIVPEITSRGGVIDKFLGDGVMAVFRAPVPEAARLSSPDLAAQPGERPRALADAAQPGERPTPLADQASEPAPLSVAGQAGHLERALEACVAARKALADMAARAGEGSPYAHGISAGVDSGPMICGSIGSRVASRLDYTVLGAVVNNAARLQSMAHKGQILVNAALCHRIEGVFQCQPVTMGETPPTPRPGRPRCRAKGSPRSTTCCGGCPTRRPSRRRRRC